MGSKLKIVIFLCNVLITFDVAIQYLQCKHLAMFARSRLHIIHKNSYFPHQ